MKKILKIISGFLWAAISITLMPAISPADTIVLKDGLSLKAENVVEQDKNICFYLHGLKMQISKKAVLRVVRTDDAPPPAQAILNEPTAEEGSTPTRVYSRGETVMIDSLPAEKPPAAQPAKHRVQGHWSGFRDLRWASSQSGFGPLKEIESGTGREEIKEYVRDNEDLKMGKARIDSIVYAFWHYQLYALTIWTRGRSNYLSMRNEIFNQFGVGLNRGLNAEHHLWSDPYSDRILKYFDTDQSGLFWMRSKELDHRYQLSRLKTLSTHLKVMKAESLRKN